MTSRGTYTIRVYENAYDQKIDYNVLLQCIGIAPCNSVTSVSATSYRDAPLARESIVASFGPNLASSTETASATPLPTSLAGTTVKVKDSAIPNTERLAPLFFVSPNQINYQLPPGTVNGPARITITRSSGQELIGAAEIVSVSPGLFSANADGQGVAAAVAVRVKANGDQPFEPVARFDPAQNKVVSVPIDLGPETDQVFLIPFGTGFRFRSSLSAATVRIGGVDSQVLYVGEAPGFIGLDQLNVRLSRSLIGRGEVDVALTVDGKAANVVRVNVK